MSDGMRQLSDTSESVKLRTIFLGVGKGLNEAPKTLHPFKRAE
jgi:hypothetical protein